MQVFNYGGMAANAIDNFGQGLNQMRERKNKEQLMQQQQDALTGLADLYSNGATTQELYEYGLQNPAAFERVGQTIGFKNDQTKQIMRDTLINSLQNPEQRDQIIAQGAEAIRAAGGDPKYLSQAIGDSTEDFERGAIPFLASLDDQGSGFAKTYMEMKPQQPERMSPYQQAQIEGKNQDRELRRQEIELRRLESEQKRAKTSQEQEAKSQQIEQKRKEVDEAKAQDKTRIDNGINTATQNKQVIDDLLNNDDYMSSITGYTGRIPAVTTTGVEAEAYLDNIKNSMTIDNLGVMSGPLTDKDIQIIASASSRLRSGMSETALKKELNTIKKAYDRVVSNYQKEANRKGYKQESEENSESKVVFSSSKYGDVTEADIQTTMQKHNMTREQVMSRLGK